jgi:hypothetical protein
MKIRIQDNSIRYRLTLKEVETLKQTGRLERSTEILNAAGPGGVFRYAVILDYALASTEVRLQGTSIELALSSSDANELFDPEKEGAYIRREWTDADGNLKRFMAFVEKDRPGSTCIKPETWIYDAQPGQPPILVPMTKKSAGAANE